MELKAAWDAASEAEGSAELIREELEAARDEADAAGAAARAAEACVVELQGRIAEMERTQSAAREAAAENVNMAEGERAFLLAISGGGDAGGPPEADGVANEDTVRSPLPGVIIS